MRVTKRQLRRIIREVIDNPVRGSSHEDLMAQIRGSDGPHEDLITALQGTFLGSPPREMSAAAWAKVAEYYPDEAKELMAMSPNKLDNLIAMAWPTGY